MPEYFFHCLPENQADLPEYYLICCPKMAIWKKNLSPMGRMPMPIKGYYLHHMMVALPENLWKWRLKSVFAYCKRLTLQELSTPAAERQGSPWSSGLSPRRSAAEPTAPSAYVQPPHSVAARYTPEWIKVLMTMFCFRTCTTLVFFVIL